VTAWGFGTRRHLACRGNSRGRELRPESAGGFAVTRARTGTSPESERHCPVRRRKPAKTRGEKGRLRLSHGHPQSSCSRPLSLRERGWQGYCGPLSPLGEGLGGVRYVSRSESTPHLNPSLPGEGEGGSFLPVYPRFLVAAYLFIVIVLILLFEVSARDVNAVHCMAFIVVTAFPRPSSGKMRSLR